MAVQKRKQSKSRSAIRRAQVMKQPVPQLHSLPPLRRAAAAPPGVRGLRLLQGPPGHRARKRRAPEPGAHRGRRDGGGRRAPRRGRGRALGRARGGPGSRPGGRRAAGSPDAGRGGPVWPARPRPHPPRARSRSPCTTRPPRWSGRRSSRRCGSASTWPRRGEVDAVVSAGNSGAMMACGLFVLGRSPGVERPAIVTTFPTKRGQCALLDMGANVDPRPDGAGAVRGARLGLRAAAARQDAPAGGPAVERRRGAQGDGAHPRDAPAAVAGGPQDGTEAEFDYVGYVEGRDIFDGEVDVDRHRRVHRQRPAQGPGRAGGGGLPHGARGGRARQRAGEAGRAADEAGAAPVQAQHRLRRDRRRAAAGRRRRGADLPRRIGRAGHEERHLGRQSVRPAPTWRRS